MLYNTRAIYYVNCLSTVTEPTIHTTSSTLTATMPTATPVPTTTAPAADPTDQGIDLPVLTLPVTLHTTCTEAGNAQVDWEVEPFPAVDIFTVEVECKSVDTGETTVKMTLLERVFDYVQGPRVVELQEEEAECTFSGWYEDGDFFNRHDISPASVTCGSDGECADRLQKLLNNIKCESNGFLCRYAVLYY